jgi:hypothetical protein
MGLYKEDVLPFHFQRLQASVLADADQRPFQVQSKRRQDSSCTDFRTEYLTIALHDTEKLLEDCVTYYVYAN